MSIVCFLHENQVYIVYNQMCRHAWLRICEYLLPWATTHILFKGLIIDRCLLLTSTPEWVVSPRRAITRSQPEWSPSGETTHSGVDVNNTHLSMINTDYNMLLAIFPSLSTNILLIKSKLKLESRAIVVGVAISPRNLGDKYRCRPHHRWRKCTRQFFFREAERVNRTASEWRHRLETTSSITRCVKRLSCCGTLSFPTKIASSTHTIYIRTLTGWCVF